MTTPEEPGLISPDEYEIARFVGIPGEQYARLIGAMRMAGRCVVPRSLLTEAADMLGIAAKQSRSDGYHNDAIIYDKMKDRVRQAAATKGAQ